MTLRRALAEIGLVCLGIAVIFTAGRWMLEHWHAW